MSAIVFGKLPAHGDFVARGLTAAQRSALDAWLSESLADARAAYPDFEARFDQALPWRCTGTGVAGAIAASQDGAGRRFPLLILTDADEAAAEDLLYAAITQRWDADQLSQAGAAPDGDVDCWFGGARTLSGEMPATLLREMLA